MNFSPIRIIFFSLIISIIYAAFADAKKHKLKTHMISRMAHNDLMQEKDNQISILREERNNLTKEVRILQHNLTQSNDQLEVEKNGSRTKDHQLLQLSLPVELNNEIDRFLELYQWQIKLTTEEETDLSKINDRSMRSRRLRLQLICQHAINDLSAHPLIKELNEEIDSVLNKNLAKCTPAERRRRTCEALIMLKFDRNAKAHEVFVSGPKVKLVKLFPNDFWNEGITAFLNAHKTGVDFKGIEPYEHR